MQLTIGQMARECGVNVETIRFYHRQGLLSIPRKLGACRKYGENELREFRFVVNAKACGLSLGAIKRLKSLGIKDCDEMREILERRHADLNQEVAQLSGLLKNLNSLRAQCEGCERDESCPAMGKLQTCSR